MWALSFYYLTLYKRTNIEDYKDDFQVWIAVAATLTTGSFIYAGATMRFYFEKDVKGHE